MQKKEVGQESDITTKIRGQDTGRNVQNIHLTKDPIQNIGRTLNKTGQKI